MVIFHFVFLNLSKIEEGKFYACGNNTFGELGFCDLKDRPHFEELNLKNEKIISITCGLNFSIALTGH